MKSIYHFLRVLLVLFVCFISFNLLFAQTNRIFINEFMASNDHTVADELGEYDDWIEIYNDNDAAINLSGYYLTDDFSDPFKWAFPDTVIAGKGFLLIWTDGDSEQGNLHAPFKLNSTGEEIGLFDGHSFIDSLQFDAQTHDISYGRMPDGGSSWHYFVDATANEPNVTSSFTVADAPGFSHESGFYQGAITLELTTPLEGAKIYYTTDGAEPTQESELYTEPIVIDSIKVIRARTFKTNYHPSHIITHTYFINEQRHLPVLSLITDPYNLWDPDSGIYVSGNNPDTANVLRDWERPIMMEFFKQDGNFGFAANAGARMHGGTSIWFEKKSFRLYFRGKYGTSWLRYPLFHAKNIDRFKRLVVFSGANDCVSDHRPKFHDVWTMLRDPLMQDLSFSIGGLVTAKEPACVYINGEFWGIYYLSERIDRYYLETNYGVEDADIIEFNHYAKEGTEDRWYELLDFLQNKDLKLDENYEAATHLIDIESFIDYNIIQIYGGNIDWPYNNCLCYRAKGDNQLWRWIMWDADYTLGSPITNTPDFNSLNSATDVGDNSTLVLRSLLQNEKFRNSFVNRFADLLNSLLLPERVNAKLDSLERLIEPEMESETERWGGGYSIRKWKEHVNVIRNYINVRPEHLWTDVRIKFDIQGFFELTINPPQGGKGNIQVNTIYPSVYPWKGNYFSNVPITLHAHPSPGYQFAGWSDTALPDTEIVTISMNTDNSIFAYFEKEVIPGEIIINEINYHSASDFDPADWVELYNPNDEAINLARWHFKDKNDENDFILPNNALIASTGFLVICKDTSQFHHLFPEVSNYYGNFDFNLAGRGELIRLFSPSGIIIDSVAYDDTLHWPIEADGRGSTLELIDPTSDNSQPESWQASAHHGSPGQPNPILTEPLISQVQIDGVTARSAVISWRTDRLANSQVEFGLDQNYNMTTPVDSQLVLDHSVRLSGLQANATYHVRAKSQTADGKVGFSHDFTFTTLDSSFLKLLVTSISVNSITQNSAIVIWHSERPATSQVLFGMEKHLENVTELDTNYVTQHAVELSNLSPMTIYYFQVRAYDLHGIEQRSDTLCFSTLNPDQFLDVILQIEVMSQRTEGWYEMPGWNFGNNGMAEQSLEFKCEGFYKFTLRARGAAAGGIWPEFRLSIDDANLATKTVDFADFDTMSVTTKIDSGWHDIKLSFTNYFSDSTGTRILIADWLKIKYTHRTAGFKHEGWGGGSLNELLLHQNYPNPANPMTRIQYRIPKAAKVSLKIYNLFGQEVRTLVNSDRPAGSHAVIWNGRDDCGQPVATGVYLYQLEIGGIIQTKKIVVLK